MILYIFITFIILYVYKKETILIPADKITRRKKHIILTIFYHQQKKTDVFYLINVLRYTVLNEIPVTIQFYSMYNILINYFSSFFFFKNFRYAFLKFIYLHPLHPLEKITLNLNENDDFHLSNWNVLSVFCQYGLIFIDFNLRTVIRLCVLDTNIFSIIYWSSEDINIRFSII